MQGTKLNHSPESLKELTDRFTAELFNTIGNRWVKGLQAPLVPVAFLLTFSWILAKTIQAPQPEYSLATLVLGLVCLGLYLFPNSKTIPWTGPLLLTAVLSFGFLWHRIPLDFPMPGLFTTNSPPDDDIQFYYVTVLDRPETRGVKRFPEWATYEPRVLIPCDLESVSNGGMAFVASGKVLVRSPSPLGSLIPGERIRVTARFKPFSEPLNPGEPFPYLWWQRKGFVGILDSKQAPTATDNTNPLHISFIKTISNLHWAKITLAEIKDWARQRLENCMGDNCPQVGLGKALLLGDTQEVDFTDWDKFKKTGTIHALAISGQHLVIAGSLVGILLSILGFAPRPSLLISTLFVVIYAILTGAAPSANRAAIMAVALAWTLLIRRRTSALNIIALAWILVTLVQPSDLASPGCQLSFFAVLLLDTWQRHSDQKRIFTTPNTPDQVLDQLEIQLAPYWKKVTIQIFLTIRDAYLVNWWVWLGICPLIAWHTNLVSLIALLIGPLVAIACTGGLVCGMLAILVPIPYLENFFGMGLVGFLNFSNWLATWGESMPMSWFYLPNSSFWGLSLWLLFLGWVTLPHVPRINRGTTIAGAFLLVCLLACTFWRTPPKDLVIHSIAVGHGTAILVEDPSGRVVLYDGGSMTGGENASKKISHVLWYLGISAIDEIIISHADSDHFNAITGILDKFKIGIVSVGPSFTNRDDRETASFFENLNSRGIPLRKVYSGLNAISGPTSFEILYPDQEYNRPPNQNAASLVIRIGYMGKTILLTGDLEPPGTEFFLASSYASPVSILMAPHHGSPSANPEKLWRRLNPGFVFSSEGDEKRSKTPGGLWGKEIPLWKTQDKGMITIKINESGISVKAFKSGEQLRVKEK